VLGELSETGGCDLSDCFLQFESGNLEYKASLLF
jgi:hypothetical protein